MVDWKNRIVETADMPVKDLKANPKNWRKHPVAQQNALAVILQRWHDMTGRDPILLET